MTYNQNVAAVLTPLTEYLATSYSPDREYVDGRVVERAMGEKQHSKVQTELTIFLGTLRARLGISVFVEQRVQVKPQRFRVPDVCVCLGEPDEEIFTSPPFLVIEILSPDDRMTEMLEKIDDYLSFGVQ
ncbi:MAG: Uma2 family endonuclease, partial [Bryobacteraceae bacterium]